MGLFANMRALGRVVARTRFDGVPEAVRLLARRPGVAFGVGPAPALRRDPARRAGRRDRLGELPGALQPRLRDRAGRVLRRRGMRSAGAPRHPRRRVAAVPGLNGAQRGGSGGSLHVGQRGVVAVADLAHPGP